MITRETYENGIKTVRSFFEWKGDATFYLSSGRAADLVSEAVRAQWGPEVFTDKIVEAGGYIHMGWIVPLWIEPS